VPLVFVVLLGMLTEGLKNLRRWREDKRTNARVYTRIEASDGDSSKRQVSS
jgi:hypothetical protein